MAERQEFSFNLGELNSISSEEVIDAGENFLGSDSEDISLIKKKKQIKEESEETTQEQSEKSPKKTKTEVAPRKQLGEDDFFSVLQGDDDEQETEEEETLEVPLEKKSKKEGQKLPVEEKEEDTEEQEEGDQNMFSVIAKDLVDHGIFNLDEDESELSISSPEELLARFQLESRKQASETLEKFIGRFGSDYQDMFNSVFVNGVSPQDYLSRYTKIIDISELDIEDDASQERIVREMYRSEGRSSEYIDKQISKLRNYGDLPEEAKEAQRVLINKQQADLKQEEQRKADEIRKKQLIKQEYFENVGNVLNEKIKAKEFDGIPVDKVFAQSTFDYMTKDRYQTKTGELLTEFDKDILDLNRPDKHDMKVKIAMLMQLLREDPKLSKLAKKAVSKETNELFRNLKKTAGTKSAPAKKETSQEPKSWFSDNNNT